ncbi:hypothetical protein ACX6XY_17095 [Streptomyces sp. O3]
MGGLTVAALFTGSLVACGTGGTGARDEGPAHSTDPAAQASPLPSRSETVRRVDPVRLVMDDPKVSADVKRDLQPCDGDRKEYPVDVSYGNLTGGSVSDVVVNVLTCADSAGIGTYVYREEGRRYTNVFMSERAPVYSEIDHGELVVVTQVYQDTDVALVPSAEEVVTYRWQSDRFVKRDVMYNEYSGAVGGEDPAPERN